MDAKRRELWEARSVPAWFSADTRLGCLCISLEPGSAFAAEEYAQQLEYSGVPDDCKVGAGAGGGGRGRGRRERSERR